MIRHRREGMVKGAAQGRPLPRTLVLTPPVAPYQAAAMPSASRIV